jgi:YfiH family protein
VSLVSASASRVRLPRPAPGWQWRRHGGCYLLQATALAELEWVVHGFTTRRGGYSRLHGRPVCNLGPVDWDRADAVERNRRRVREALGARKFRLVLLEQIHSALVRRVERAASEPLRGDAAVTDRPGLLLGVRTADCVPVLIADRRRRVVAAVHAGWRGTLARIAQKTVGDLRMFYGSAPTDLVAAIGPRIGVCCYEVGAEVALAFAAQFAEAAVWFEGPFEQLATGYEPLPLQWLLHDPPGHERPRRVRLNLAAANRAQLLAAGIPAGQIFDCGLCTACHVDWLFSYRREGAATGRQMGLIGLRGRRRSGHRTSC